MKTNEPKPITITIDVAPPKKGARAIIVSGAPAGEMPVVHTGVFADLHALINTTWAELQRREPQVPTIKPETVKVGKPDAGKPATAGQADDDAQDDAVAEGADEAPAQTANDQLVVIEPGPLPEIAGDTAGVDVADTASAVNTDADVTPEDVLEAAIVAAHQEPHG